MKKSYLIFLLALLMMAFASCSAPKYLALPREVSCPVIKNTCSFGIQNMDQQANVESYNLTCHYQDFDVQYLISNDFIISFTIINKSNKDLLIDKTQCFVLFDGNSTQMFKDVRMSGSTTFNDVTGAINVSTSHGSVMMTIPSYSKWSPTLNETNLRSSLLPIFRKEEGVHHLTAFDNPEPVEFIIPYSYDGTLKKWNTSRNKLYVNTINVERYNVLTHRGPGLHVYTSPSVPPRLISTNEYNIIKVAGIPDFTEVDRIDDINQQLFKKHNTQVVIGRVIGGILTLPTLGGPILFWWAASMGCYDRDHKPPR